LWPGGSAAAPAAATAAEANATAATRIDTSVAISPASAFIGLGMRMVLAPLRALLFVVCCMGFRRWVMHA
jgi:uncharacterized membrane protein (UPF0127 family)